MIKLKQEADKIELVKLIGSKNPGESKAAQEAFAAAIGPVINEVLNQANTASLFYEDWAYNPDDQPSIPLDMFVGENAGYVQVWYMPSIAGGLPSSQIESAGELKVATYVLESAVNFAKKYARKSNFNVLNMAINRMTQEILVKQELQSWAVVLRALGEANTNGAASHLISATTADVLQVDDFNRLLTLSRRLNKSFANGTPTSFITRGITDIFVSPEMKEQIRGFAYQPMNTRQANTAPATSVTAVPLPDAIRQAIFNGGGTESIYGIGITELNELGTNQKYNTLFNTYKGSFSFTPSTDELVIGVDSTLGAFKRVVATDPLSNSSVVVSPDDQFPDRSDKVGFYANIEQGNVCINAKAIVGLKV